MGQYHMSERHACRLMDLARTTHRYQARKAERDSELRRRLKELAAKRMRFGYRRLTVMLAQAGIQAKSQADIPAVSRGRIDDAHSAAAADLLDGSGEAPGGDPAERALVD